MALKEIDSSELLSWRRRQLSEGGRAVDLDWLLEIAGGLSWSELQRVKVNLLELVVLEESLEHLSSLWRRHLDEHIPLQYLIGRCPWRDIELEVNSSALIPRQETELLVDIALSKVENNGLGTWADLGTGSGALAVALSRSLPEWVGHAVDCSQDALDLAERNLQRLAGKAKWNLHCGNWWTPLKPWWGELDLVLVNPPYIPSNLIGQLAPVVRDHEPRLALCGGVNGLRELRLVIAGAMKALSPGGYLFLEHHHDQSDLVIDKMSQEGLKDLQFERDLNGVRRFALGRRPAALIP